MAQALKSRCALALLAQIDHPSGTARFWSGVGTLVWNGYSWTGAGVLGTITPIRHITDISIQELEFTIAGVDPAIAAGLSTDVRNRSGLVWLAAIDTRGNVIADPVQVVDSQLDYQSNKITEDGTVVIVVTARTGFYTLERSINDVWSSEDQKSRFPSDSGLDLVSSLQNQDLIWAPS